MCEADDLIRQPADDKGNTSSGPSGHLPQRGKADMELASAPQRGSLNGEIGEIIAEMMRPLMQSIAKMLENNTATLEQIAAAQQVQADRLEALERQVRLQTPVSAKQAAYLGAAAKDRARELLERYRMAENEKAVRKLSGQIRKAVLARYGAAGLREIPAHEYGVAMSQIGMWNNVIAVRDVVKETRETSTVCPSGATISLTGGELGQLRDCREAPQALHSVAQPASGLPSAHCAELASAPQRGSLDGGEGYDTSSAPAGHLPLKGKA